MQVVQLSFACPLRNQWHFAEASVSEVPATESRSTRHRFEKKSWSSNRFPSGKSRRRVVSPRTKATSHGRASNSDREQQRLCAWKDRQPPPRQRKAVRRHKRSASQISHPATGRLQLHGREEKQRDNRCLTMPQSRRRASPSASLTPPFFDRQQNLGDRFAARLRAQVSFAVNANAYSIGFHVALSDHKHGVDFHLFGALNFAVDLVGAVVDLRADLMSAQFFQDRSCVIEQLWIIADGQNTHLFRRQPERGIAGVVVDYKSE